MADLVQPVTDALRKTVRSPPIGGEGCPERLREAMEYALLAPGKRLRPALVLMGGEVCGIDPHSPAAEKIMPAAVAVEMIHAYSLIHDDLPAMDDDDLRRGRPTVHLKYDEATAILAGDGLLAGAFAVLAQNVDTSQIGDAVLALASASGPTQLVGGQADDLAAEHFEDAPAATIEHLESIHRRKTGALIECSLGLGARIAGAEEPVRRRLSDYARDLGLAFQVVDDLLDAGGGDAKLGKRAGKDADRGKLTYPGLLGVQGARQKAEQLVESAIRHAELLGNGAWRLRKLAKYVLERTH